jgi:hypothetical protein
MMMVAGKWKGLSGMDFMPAFGSGMNSLVPLAPGPTCVNSSAASLQHTRYVAYHSWAG